MSDDGQNALRAWIEHEFTISGVLAAGGAGPGQPAFAAFASGEFVLANDSQVWQCVMENIAALRTKGAPVGELLWGFEHAVLCTIQRDDGGWLGVFTVPHLPDEPAIELRAKLDAFKQLQLGE